MSLTIKNPVTLELVQELAAQSQVSQTQAITDAVRLNLLQLTRIDRKSHVDSLLSRIWANQSADEKARIQARQNDLYDEKGLPR